MSVSLNNVTEGAGSAVLPTLFNSLETELVVLDERGIILSLNEAWSRFIHERGGSAEMVAPGVNYLETCRHVALTGDSLAEQIKTALEHVLGGEREEASIEYACDSSTGRRWFLMRISRLDTPVGGAVIAQAEITQLKKTQAALRDALAQVEALKTQMRQEQVYRRQHSGWEQGQRRIVGKSEAIRHVLAQTEQVAQTDATVLLLGETGTGKELLAYSIHDSSSRRDRTLIGVNCAAMPGTLVESELFGREKGAFTGSLSRQIGRFELANESTLFLDEVAEFSLELQAKLLRVLETKQIERLGNPKPVPVNVRVIAATNRDLEKAVAEGKFRQDLYYRLNVFPITLPPLRERREDIPLLVWAFVDEFAKRFSKNVEAIDRKNLDLLQRYSWPGNIRELRNVIERAMIVATGPKLRVALPTGPALATGQGRLDQVERDHILSVLTKTGWRVRGANGAADELGLKATTLEARMAKLGIHRPTASRRVSSQGV